MSLVGILGVVYPYVSAQSDVDALRYSFTQSGYTAKSLSLGGAVGALGADIGAAIINPASLAQYKKGEFSISFGLNNIRNTSVYLSKEKRENLFLPTVPSFGFVFTKRYYENGEAVKKGWVNSNIGFSMGRINQFSRITSFTGVNSQNSMTDYFSELAKGFTDKTIGGTDDDFNNGFELLEKMAWESYLINYDPTNGNFYANVNPANRNIIQKNTITSRGATNQFSITVAANYSNKLYIGGALNIDRTRYIETNKYTEINDANSATEWQNFILENKLTTIGTGISGNIGMLYHINEFFRFGLAYNTPKNYNLDDNYSFSLVTTSDSGYVSDLSSKKGYYTYSIMTPSKSTFSLAYLFGKKGFISGDLETVDYSSMRIRSDEDAFEASNELIQNKYRRVYNMRVGAEIVQDVFRFRAGYSKYDSPMKNNKSNLITQSISGGIGIKEKYWGLDIGLIHTQRKDNFQPYVLNQKQVPVSENTLRNNQIILSFTYSF